MLYGPKNIVLGAFFFFNMVLGDHYYSVYNN